MYKEIQGIFPIMEVAKFLSNAVDTDKYADSQKRLCRRDRSQR